MQNTVSSDVFMLQAYSSVVNISYTVQNTVCSQYSVERYTNDTWLVNSLYYSRSMKFYVQQ